jgi:hypothetical protein
VACAFLLFSAALFASVVAGLVARNVGLVVHTFAPLGIVVAQILLVRANIRSKDQCFIGHLIGGSKFPAENPWGIAHRSERYE